MLNNLKPWFSRLFAIYILKALIMGKIVLTESQITNIVAKATRRLLREANEKEEINSLLMKSKEWRRSNPTRPGNENPYDGEIWHAIVKYYIKYYNAVLTYKLPNGRVMERSLDKNDIQFALYHAVFDRDTVEDCIYLIERWILRAYEDNLYNELGDKLPDEYDLQVNVESRPKTK